MNEDLIVKTIIALAILGVVNLAATVISNYVAGKIVIYRIAALEKSVEKHNKFASRITTLEATLAAEAAHGS